MEKEVELTEKKKMPKVTKFLAIIDAMNGVSRKIKGWNSKFHVVRNDDGTRDLLREIDNGVVIKVHKEDLISDVITFCNTKTGTLMSQVTSADSAEIAKMWIGMQTTIDEPVSFAFKSDNKLTYHRIDFDLPDANFNTPPLFEEILSRCSNKFALCMFIGSLFDPLADKQQYLWIHGEGRNGKGSLAALLQKVLGPAYHSETVSKNSLDPNQFWTSSFLNKRLVLFSECEAPDFPTKGIFKSLTGGDSIRMEVKRKDAFTKKLDCKFIFTSNEELSISGSKADIRRAIYCKLDHLTGAERGQDYITELLAEAPAILRECIDLYYEKSGPGQSIPVEEDAELQASLHDEKYMALFNKYFEETPDKETFVSAQQLEWVFNEEGIKSAPAKGSYIKVWSIQFGVTKRRTNVTEKDPKRFTHYHGMKLKEKPVYPDHYGRYDHHS